LRFGSVCKNPSLTRRVVIIPLVFDPLIYPSPEQRNFKKREPGGVLDFGESQLLTNTICRRFPVGRRIRGGTPNNPDITERQGPQSPQSPNLNQAVKIPKQYCACLQKAVYWLTVAARGMRETPVSECRTDGRCLPADASPAFWKFPTAIVTASKRFAVDTATAETASTTQTRPSAK
jgi:hypothetical protein